MDESKIKNIILDLYFFRPPAIKSPEKAENNVTIEIQQLENNKTFIIERNGGTYDVDNPFNFLIFKIFFFIFLLKNY